ncbi:MAG: putative sulfate exporter family transporter [Actinobacteria bacterium]|nr:putative sulfate exporter family transporter [Actinomycetota bacterium]
MATTTSRRSDAPGSGPAGGAGAEHPRPARHAGATGRTTRAHRPGTAQRPARPRRSARTRAVIRRAVAGLTHRVVPHVAARQIRPGLALTRSIVPGLALTLRVLPRLAVARQIRPDLALARRVVPGLAVCLLVAAAAGLVAPRVPFGSAPVLAIVLGLIVGALLGPRPTLRPGIQASSSTLLRGAVVALGAALPLTTVLAQGIRSLPVIVVTLGGCLLTASLLGRRLGILDPLRTLIAVGTGICGASAIAAVTPVTEADDTDVGYAVATIFLFNVLAVLTFPPLGHALGMSQHAFGVFSGTAINDLSSVVAAGNVYGTAALSTGIVVKLTRTLMIVPICAVLAERQAERSAADSGIRGAGHIAAVEGDGGEDVEIAAVEGDGGEARNIAAVARTGGRGDLTIAADKATGGRHSAAGGRHIGRAFLRAIARTPRFLIAFLALAALASTGLIPTDLTPEISDLATAMITVALAAVGLSIDLAALHRTGTRPILLGAALWLTVSALSLGMMALGFGS